MVVLMAGSATIHDHVGFKLRLTYPHNRKKRQCIVVAFFLESLVYLHARGPKAKLLAHSILKKLDVIRFTQALV